MYAIVKTGGKQYKVAAGDYLNIEKLDAEVGAKVPLTAIDVYKRQLHKGYNKAEARERALELLELVGLADKANKYPSQLSGGQQQRVAIARALINRPSIMLCDEATSALDTMTTQSILRLLKDINEELGVTLVLITHSLLVAEQICDTVAVIDDGRIVEMGRTQDIFENPQSDASRQLLGKEC